LLCVGIAGKLIRDLVGEEGITGGIDPFIEDGVLFIRNEGIDVMPAEASFITQLGTQGGAV
jgi:hypothetical protein